MIRLGYGLALGWLLVAGGCGHGADDPGASSGEGGETSGSATADSSGSGTGASASGGAGGMGTGGAAMGCVPTPGDSMLDTGCDEIQLAIMQHRGATSRVQISGRIFARDGACIRIETIDLVRGDLSVVQTVASGISFASSDMPKWGEADAIAEVSDPCKGDEPRVEAFGVIARGEMDGGTFEAKCGKAELGSAWPPRVMLTCHEGLETPPSGSYANVAENGALVSATFSTQFHEPPTVESIEGDIRILPASWMGPSVDAFDTTGWSVSMSPNQPNVVGASFEVLDDPFGPELCPVPIDNPMPGDEPPPILLARVKGQTDGGPFSSEVFLRACMRIVM